jgi:hypothetical protein
MGMVKKCSGYTLKIDLKFDAIETHPAGVILDVTKQLIHLVLTEAENNG